MSEQTDIVDQRSADQGFFAMISPHRSLSGPGFVVLMCAVGVVSFAAGIFFLQLGAWPVFGFFGLDAALIYWAFRRNYADARLYESVQISGNELIVRHVPPKGEPFECRFQAYWVRVELEENSARDICGPLWLTSHGRRVQIGAFLGPGELRAFARTLERALAGVPGV